MKRTLAATFLFAALVAACRGEEKAIQERLQERGTADVMAEFSKALYAPPADGRLTDRQIRMYLEVKERGRKIREVAVQDRAEEDGLVISDLRAALELGHNPKDFTWVGERIAEAEEVEAMSTLEQRVEQSREEYLAMLEEERKAATEEAQKAEIDQQIEEFKRAREARTEVNQVVGHNMELLSRYKDELGAARWAEASQRKERAR
ncbi:MAG TPA: hypothetical protein VE685_16665 [Thermoanaerobaculia bacterium]|nr:hypothetical protein [Thermoanaerobaculia bacterium]